MIYIGCDHAGCDMKNDIIAHLSDAGIKTEDMGCNGERCDYPDIAESVADKVLEDLGENLGILICGTGIGMSIAANKIKGIRAAHCTDEYSAKYSRLHNDANIICIGARITGSGLACEMVDLFLNTKFEGGRHENRVRKIKNLEED